MRYFAIVSAIKDSSIHQVFGKSLVPWIGRTAKFISVFIGQKLKEADVDLTTKQWILLRILTIEDGRPQHDLALLTERNKASLVRLIHTMERKGLVERRQDIDDRRVNRIYLTDFGRSLFQSALPTVASAFEELQVGIKEHELDLMVETMGRVIENIRKSEDKKESK